MLEIILGAPERAECHLSLADQPRRVFQVRDERTVDASPTSPTVKIASILKSRADEMPFGDTFSSDPDGRSRLSSKAGHEAFEASDASGSMIKVTALLRNKINYSDKMERKTNKMTDKSDSNKVPEKADSNKMTEKSQGNAASLDGAYSRSSSRANRKEVTLVDVPKPPEVKDRPAPPHVSSLPSMPHQMSEDSTPLAHLNPRIDGTIGAASQWKHATKKLQAVQVMIPPKKGDNPSKTAMASAKMSKKFDFLRANSDKALKSCPWLDRVAGGVGACFGEIYQVLELFREWVSKLEEPRRTSCLGQAIRHQAFEAAVLLTVVANSIYIAYEANYHMATLGQQAVEFDETAVEICFLALFTMEIALRMFVHRLYFFVNDDWLWNLMDTGLLCLAYVDQALLLGGAVGKVGLLRLLRLARLFRIVRVLRYLKEVRVMLVAILGSFLSLFWALLMLAVIIFMFAIYFMQQMTTYLSITPSDDELWSLQLDYFQNTGRAMYVLLMATTGGKEWEEVYLLLAPLGADCTVAFTFYLLFFTLGVLNIITGVFVENASVLFKPDDREALQESMRQVQEDIEQVTAILEAMDVDGSGILSTRQVIDAMQDDMFEHALHTIGIDIRMPEHYFNTLSSVTGQEELSIDEFVAHIVQMKGSVSRPDLQTLTLETALLQREVHKLGFELHRVLSLIQQMCVEQGEIKVERQEGPEEVKNNSTLREGLYEEFLKHQRDMQKRAEGRGSSSLFSGPFNFRAVMHSMRKVAPKDLWASEAGHHSTSRVAVSWQRRMK